MDRRCSFRAGSRHPDRSHGFGDMADVQAGRFQHLCRWNAGRRMSEAMKAISLWQPWASLWCSTRKVHETRRWPTSHHGWLAVHAAKKLVSDCGEELDEIAIAEFGSY